MKKLMILLLAVAFLGSSVSYAGHGSKCSHGPEKKEKYIQKKMNKMEKNLDLTVEQQSQVEVILRSKMDKKHAAKKQMYDEMQGIRDEYRTKMNGVLSEDQRGKFEKMMAQYDKKKHHKRKKRFFIF